MPEIRIGIDGRIVRGDDMGWFIKIEENVTDKTGGYYIFVKNGLNVNGAVGYDYWVKEMSELEEFFVESDWEIEWLEGGN